VFLILKRSNEAAKLIHDQSKGVLAEREPEAAAVPAQLPYPLSVI
jgi:hypothetical protein